MMECQYDGRFLLELNERNREKRRKTQRETTPEIVS